jgi:hypothetical protein
MAAMAVTCMTMAVKVMKAAAKAAYPRPADGNAMRTGHRFITGTAGPGPRGRKPGRGGADGGAPHQGQYDAARAFHDVSFPDQARSGSGKIWIRQVSLMRA